MTNNVVRSLPEDLLSEILRYAASNSITDFVNTKLSCKAFYEVSNTDQIFKNVSMEKFNLIPWRKSERVFQKRCIAAENTEALYRKGMIDCFSRRKSESGLRCLKKATEKGHVETIYAYGIILICFGGELREQGLQIVSSLNLMNSNGMKKSSKTIVNCRSKTERFLSNMWVYVTLTKSKHVDCNCNPDINGKKSMRWSSSQDQAWEHKQRLRPWLFLGS
ncbi:hypothetical protein GQ457_16G011030 [Hibiscus cannabinus]